MDIDGAKALNERLARGRAAKATPASGEIPEGAPPVYHWFAFRESADGATPALNDGGSAENGPTAGLGFPPTSQ